MRAAAVLTTYVEAFVTELVRAGVREVCLCPGSRSTPLALTFARHPEVKIWTHIDERSAAYFALGLAQIRRAPVVLLATSGSAGANFFPAVLEAYYARVPLVVLTADRPHELRGSGAPQTIDQIHLYGSQVKWFVEMAPPETSPEVERYVRTMAIRAAATASAAPQGPVHLNFPFREPLVPVPPPEVKATVKAATLAQPAPAGSEPPVMAAGCEKGLHAAGANSSWICEEARPGGEALKEALGVRPPGRFQQGLRMLPQGEVAAWAHYFAQRERGLIICGPQPDPQLAQSIVLLAEALDYPILADPLSHVRCGAHERRLVLDAYDAYLRNDDFSARYRPEVTIRFGALPTSKPLLLYSQRHTSCTHIVVDGGDGWRDPTSTAEVIHADEQGFCLAVAKAVREQRTAKREQRTAGEPSLSIPSTRARSRWSSAWVAVDRLVRDTIAAHVRCDNELDEELFEGRVFAELAELLPEGATLFAGNSMPVRDMDTFFPGSERSLRLLANRGTNGIDGVVSSALGVSAASEGPTVLVIGDLSFYHDLNGLLAAKRHALDATIVLVHNDGGGIFSFLPQAEHAEHFDLLFGTPTGLDFEPVVGMYGGRFARATSWPAFREAVQRGIRSSGLDVIELRTDRNINVAQHRQVWDAVADALRQSRWLADERTVRS